jgi:hypothetical protein
MYLSINESNWRSQAPTPTRQFLSIEASLSSDVPGSNAMLEMSGRDMSIKRLAGDPKLCAERADVRLALALADLGRSGARRRPASGGEGTGDVGGTPLAASRPVGFAYTRRASKRLVCQARASRGRSRPRRSRAANIIASIEGGACGPHVVWLYTTSARAEFEMRWTRAAAG